MKSIRSILIFLAIYHLMIYPIQLKSYEKRTNENKTNENKTLIGLWQKESKLVAAGLRTHYRFYKDSTVVYGVSEFNVESPFKGFIGRYRMKDTILLIKIEKYDEIVDFELELGSPAIYYNDWLPEKGKHIFRKAKDSTWVSLPIKFEKGTVFINEHKYYLLSRNPDEHK